MKSFFKFLLEFLAKLILSFIAWIIFYVVSWQLFIGDHAGEIALAWVTILSQAYYYILLIYLVIDYGILTRWIKPKRPRIYWVVTALTILVIAFCVGLAVHYSPSLSNLLFWEADYFHSCLFQTSLQMDYCDRFPLYLNEYLKHQFE